MALARDLSALPTPAVLTGDGRKPDPEPTFLRPYFDAIRERNAAEGERPHAVEGTRFRHSMAHACARQIAYHALRVPPSDPMDLTGMIVTGNGTAKHDEIQAHLTAAYADDPTVGFQIEVPCQIPGFDASGNADALLVRRLDARHSSAARPADVEGGGDALRLLAVDGGDVSGLRDDRGSEPEQEGQSDAPGGVGVAAGSDPRGPAHRSPLRKQALREPGAPGAGDAAGEQPAGVGSTRICWELKNIGGFAFKKAVGERGRAEGPKAAHVVQGALNAKALDADLLVITYTTWEAISVGIAASKGFTEEGRISAQWTYTREEWEPLADQEVARVSGILALLDEGTLPARRFPDAELPKGHRVTDPTRGQWQVQDDEGQILDAGTWWACGYCRWQTVCASTDAGRQPISEVAVALGLEVAA